MKRNGQDNGNAMTAAACSGTFAAFACAASATVFSLMLNVSLSIFVSVVIILVLAISLLAVLRSLRLIRREPPSYIA